MRALVTGGAGFIGSNLVDALVARGDDVVVLDDLSSGKRSNVNPATRFVEGSILTDALEEAMRDAEICFHLAAQADVPTSVARPEFYAQVNVLGTVRVLAAAGDAPVVFSSTGGAIYGECRRPAREDDPLLPLSPYGIAKLAGEEYLSGWNRMHGTRHTALRFANVYGPRQEAGLEGGVVAIFLNAMAAGGETWIYGDGQQTRDFVHVDDVVDGLVRCARRSSVSPFAPWARCWQPSGAEARSTSAAASRRRSWNCTSSAARSRATCASRASARRARATSCAASSTCRSSSASSAGGSRSRSTTGCAGPGTG